jgi:CspA family cold shock protein
MGDKASSERRYAAIDETLGPDNGDEAALAEISGAIKWFDVAKGYGSSCRTRPGSAMCSSM